MSTDRELFEMAAKAAGVKINHFNSQGEPVINQPGGGPESCLVKIWNPLTDDGDALRLAVQLGLLNTPEWMTYRNVAFFATNAQIGEATRIGIVRAAAEIGRAMP